MDNSFTNRQLHEKKEIERDKNETNSALDLFNTFVKFQFFAHWNFTFLIDVDLAKTIEKRPQQFHIFFASISEANRKPKVGLEGNLNSKSSPKNSVLKNELEVAWQIEQEI